MKKKWLLLVSVIFALAAGGCSGEYMESIYGNDSKIAEESDTYNRVKFIQNIKNNKCTVNAGKMEGMYTIWNCKAPDDTEMDIVYDISVEKGKFKLVLITPDDTVETVVEVTAKAGEENSETKLELKKGKNRMKAVAGKDTKFKMELSVSEGSFSGR